MTCKVHRRYQAKRKPRVPCEDCWRQWFNAVEQRNFERNAPAMAKACGLDKESMDEWSRLHDDWINSPG
jgi:hypothetical protein